TFRTASPASSTTGNSRRSCRRCTSSRISRRIRRSASPRSRPWHREPRSLSRRRAERVRSPGTRSTRSPSTRRPGTRALRVSNGSPRTGRSPGASPRRRSPTPAFTRPTAPPQASSRSCLRKRRVHVLHGFYGAEIPYSCTYIRLLCPLSHPALAERIELTHGTTEAIPDCDLLVVERHTLWPYERQLDGFVRVLSRCRQRGVPVVYELDDNLLDLRRGEPWETYPGDSLRAVVAFLARQSDGMIVSTPALAERLARLRSDVLVVPNALDERLFGSAPEPVVSHSPNVTIGYM